MKVLINELREIIKNNQEQLLKIQKTTLSTTVPNTTVVKSEQKDKVTVMW